MIKHAKILLLLVAATGIGATAAMAANVERGEKVFKKCKACHQVGEGAKNKTGPILNNIVDRTAASQADFKYSKALQTAAKGGLIWDMAALDAFLLKPRDFLKGTRMSFAGLKKAEDRTDVIAYLQSFSETQKEAFTVAPEILAIVGDAEYGQYLSSECTTCHLNGDSANGIPVISGWDIESFVTQMHAYRAGAREHEVMQTITKRLSDEEIAGLAVYFAAQQ